MKVTDRLTRFPGQMQDSGAGRAGSKLRPSGPVRKTIAQFLSFGRHIIAATPL
jgi:hypothetical protein